MISHSGTVPLKTERLVLRRFTIADAADVFNKWTGSAEVSRFVMRSPHKSVQEAEQMLREHEKNYTAPDFYMWAIEYENELIGYICGNEIIEHLRSITIGYCIAKSCWNKGIVTEASKAIIRHFFGLGFNRIASSHHPQNPASGKVMEKCGMRFEGRIRGGSILAGKICDAMQYAILAGDVGDAVATEQCSSPLCRQNRKANTRPER